MEPKRAQWGSKIGFILAAAGSAVGLGNIWKFPGKAYEGGGGAYILIYLAIVLLIGIPVMLSELTIGRGAQANAIDSYGKLGHPGYKWVGWFGVIVAFIITSYYCHVGGWVLRYVASYATEATKVYADPLGYFYALLGYNAVTGETWFPLTAVIFAGIFMGITCFIIVKGVESGIERFNKIGMPALFVILIILLIRALTMPGAGEGLQYMLIPDWSKVTFSTGILWQGSTKDCELEFRIADKETVDALASGAQTLDLTITLSTVSRLFVLDLKNKTVTPQ